MFKDKTARTDIRFQEIKIEALEKRVKELESLLEDHDEKYAIHSRWPTVGMTEVIRRFEELYDHLGVERATTPEVTALRPAAIAITHAPKKKK